MLHFFFSTPTGFQDFMTKKNLNSKASLTLQILILFSSILALPMGSEYLAGSGGIAFSSALLNATGVPNLKHIVLFIQQLKFSASRASFRH